MSVNHLHLLAVAAALGCAATPGISPTSGIPRSAANVLTFDEIANAHADVSNAYDAISRLRPNWLAPHGVTSTVAGGAGTEYATVFVDGQPYGDINSLHNISAFHVSGLRYYNITEAGGRYGIRGGSSGVIEVSTNLPSRSQ
jgi:hypothetical protein